MSKDVLIAGCGYVGCALAELLRKRGHAVTGLRRNAAALPDGIAPLAVDMADAQATKHALGDRSFDWVVYAAAADGRDEAAYRSAYVDGLRHVLEAVRVRERLVFTSSTAVYGQNDGEEVDEESDTRPSRFTGEIMLEAEAQVAAHDATSTVLRFGGIYGPSRTRLVERVARGEAELPAGPRYTNRIHRDDCAGVAAHVLSLAAPAPIYVGVDDESADLRDVLRWIAERLGRPVPPIEDGPPPARGKRCNNARLRSTAYAFRYPTFREGYAELTSERG
jgi:nucleoside-diphosphate-sugar epimerase